MGCEGRSRSEPEPCEVIEKHVGKFTPLQESVSGGEFAGKRDLRQLYSRELEP